MAITPCSARYAGSARSLRQFEGAVHRSRTTSPRRAGRSDWQSSRLTP